MTVALYARVSGSKQEKEETIQSQLSLIRERLETDQVTVWGEFIDQGYSRDNLIRPQLDKLRDQARDGHLEKLYIHNPDRLASGAKLLILIEDFQKYGVEVVFCIGATDDNPEGRLLMGVQAIIAEYEKTKIAERTRRGRDYWARQGAIVSGQAPYGYSLAKNGQQRTCLIINEE